MQNRSAKPLGPAGVLCGGDLSGGSDFSARGNSAIGGGLVSESTDSRCTSSLQVTVRSEPLLSQVGIAPQAESPAKHRI